MSKNLKVKTEEEIGDCVWPRCNKLGIYWLDGKCYCPQHYSQVINSKRTTLRADLGATTVPNEGGM